MAGNKIKYISTDVHLSPYPYNLPYLFNIKEKIIKYKFDQFNKCFYYLVYNGIYRKCYFNNRTIIENKIEKIYYGDDIQDFYIDIYMDYLYIILRNAISIINLKIKVETTIYSSQNFIYGADIFPQSGYILILK